MLQFLTLHLLILTLCTCIAVTLDGSVNINAQPSNPLQPALSRRAWAQCNTVPNHHTPPIDLTPCTLGMPSDCIHSGIGAVIDAFTSAFRESQCNNATNHGNVTKGKCADIPGWISPTPDQRRTTGGTNLGGCTHDIAFRSVGRISGVRAVQREPTAARRRSDDVAAVDGYVVAYFWENNLWKKLYDDFPHGWTGLADYATDKVMEGNYSSVCLTLGYDSHGRGRPINAGVLTIGTNGKELFWDDETLQKSLDACYVNVSMGDNSPEYLDFEVISVAVRTGVSNSS